MSSGQEVGQIFGDGTGPATALLRSPIVLISAIALWAMNVALFKYFHIDYVAILTGRSSGSSSKGKNETMQQQQSHNIAEGKASAARHRDASHNNASPPSSLKMLSSPVRLDKESESDGELGHPIVPPVTSEVTARRLLILATFLFTLLQAITYFWIEVMGQSALGALFSFYAAAFFFMSLPLQSTRWIRVAVNTVLIRTLELLKPRCYGNMKPVPFIDVFFADAMCSLSKVFFDWGMLIHLAWHYPRPVPHSTQSIVIPSAVAAIPYIIRARQCIIMHTIGGIKNDPNKKDHALNALKYCSSLFPICLSAYQKTLPSKEEADSLEFYLVVLMTINSLYCFYWDVVMDWGMMHNPTAVLEQACVSSTISGAELEAVSSPNKKEEAAHCGHKCLRPKLRFGFGISIGIFTLDFILRMSWLLRFYESMIFPSVDVYILTTELLEVFRRSIWNLLRVEWEKIKTSRSSFVAPIKIDIEDDPDRALFLPRTEMTTMRS